MGNKNERAAARRKPTNQPAPNNPAPCRPSNQPAPNNPTPRNPGNQPETDSAKTHFERALDEVRQGRHEAALRRMTQLCMENVLSADVHGYRVYVLLEVARFTEDVDLKEMVHKDAVRAAEIVLKLSPDRIEYSQIYAHILYKIATDEKDYEAVVKECERALALENPADPGKSAENQNTITTFEGRIADVQKKLRSYIQISKAAAISTWMKNLHIGKNRLKLCSIPDEIKKATKTAGEQMKEIEASIAAEGRDRLQWYWKYSMTSDMKKDFLRIKISDLKEHFSKSKDGSPGDELNEALSFAEANKVWKVLTCFPCKERFSDTSLFLRHVSQKHSATFSPYESDLPTIVGNEWVNKLLECSWKPIELKKSLGQENWPLSDDATLLENFQAVFHAFIKRATLLESIHAVFHALVNHKYLASSHLQKVIEFASNVLQGLEGGDLVISSKMYQTPSCICLLGAEELEKILEYLEEISHACGMSTCPDQSDVIDVSEAGVQRVDIVERVTFSVDCSFLVLEEHFLPCKIPGSSCNGASSGDSSSAISSHIIDDNDVILDSDPLFSWLFTGPTSEEQFSSWTSVREEKIQQGVQTLQLIGNKSRDLVHFLEMKYDHLKNEEALRAVEGLCSQREKKREDATPNYASVLRDELTGSSIVDYAKRKYELAAISAVLNDAQKVNQLGLKETNCGLVSQLCGLESGEVDKGRTKNNLQQENFCIEVAIQRQKDRVSLELCHADAIIMKIIKEMEHLEDMLKNASSQDYSIFLVPLVKLFLRARLEDLAEKYATENYEAVKKALTAELAQLSKRSVNAEVAAQNPANVTLLGTGLKNEVGKNNCFVNVIIQSLWHLELFRDELVRRSKHPDVIEERLVCALSDIFTALSMTPSDNRREAVDPSSLLDALREEDSNKSFFKEGQMNDASEVLGYIFNSLHRSFTPATAVTESVDAKCKGQWDCTYDSCLSHSIFGMNILLEMECKYCHTVSRERRTSYVQYITASSLRAKKVECPEKSFSELLNQLLREREGEGVCGCGEHNFTNFVLSTTPHVFTTVMSWQNAGESVEDITETLAALSTDIDINQKRYCLVSVVCFIGLHYICFAYRRDLGEWVICDDKIVKAIGEWSDVLVMCKKERLQPTTFFFEAVQN